MKKIKYQADILEHFIPISLERLIADLLKCNALTADQKNLFKHFCSRYIAIYNANSHLYLQYLKRLYQAFNPDRDALILEQSNTEQPLSLIKSEIYELLNDANYQRISEDDLNAALNKISPHGVKVSVDFDEFVEVGLFYRGCAIETKMIRNWKKLSFKKQPVEIQTYRRLFILLQPKNREQWIEHLVQAKNMSLKSAQKKADKVLQALGTTGNETVVYMKMFKDIPRSDMEMLFPNTRVQIRLFDKLKIGIMGGGGTVGGVMATISKLSAAIDPISALLAIGALLGVLWRQIAKVFRQRAKYSAILTKNLYFYSLNTNWGALTYLLDSAKSEESKEALLAYYFLLTQDACDRHTLDQQIEKYIQEQYAIPMDFDINDGLKKLEQENLLIINEDKLTVKPLEEANHQLTQQWLKIIESDKLMIAGE